MGIERIILALKDVESPALPNIKVYLVALDETAFKEAFVIMDALRKNGIASDISYNITSVKSQMRQANKAGAQFVLIIGEAELKKNVVTLKDMDKGHQEEVSSKGRYQDLIKYLNTS